MKKIRARFTIVIYSLLILLTACEKDTFKVKGVINNITGMAVSSADVALYIEGTSDIKYSANTDTEGKYLLSGIEEGYYDIRVTSDGYI